MSRQIAGERLSLAQIAALRGLHDGCIAQDLGDVTSDRVVTVPVYRENAAFLLACNNSIRQLLDEVEHSRKVLCEVERMTSVGPPSPPNRPKTAASGWYDLLVRVNAYVRNQVAEPRP